MGENKIVPESVKLNKKKWPEGLELQRIAGFTPFHLASETAKMPEVLTTQGIAQPFEYEFCGFR